MKFLIRDDDPCGFTRPDELISCYKDIWDDIPVNFSVTPFRIPSKDKNAPESLYGSNEVIPLENNYELVDLLKQLYAEKKVDFAMHGYNHIKPNGLPEYVGGKDLYNKTKEGKKYLESILECQINTFVPPHNSIMREGFDAVIGNNMNLVGVPSLIRSSYRPFEITNISKYVQQRYYMTKYKINYPHIFKFNDHMEVNHFSVTPSQTMDVLKRSLNRCYELDAVFVFAVHYHAFDKRLRSGERIKDVLHEIIGITKEMSNINYVTYKDLWNQE